MKKNINNQIRTTRISATVTTFRVKTVSTTTRIAATTTNITQLQEIQESTRTK